MGEWRKKECKKVEVIITVNPAISFELGGSVAASKETDLEVEVQ